MLILIQCNRCSWEARQVPGNVWGCFVPGRAGRTGQPVSGDEEACDFAWQKEDRNELTGHEEATKAMSTTRRIYEGNEILQ